MKAVYCESCGDLFNLRQGKMKSCSCGKVFGRYIDERNAEVSKDAISIGIGSGALRKAIITLTMADNFKDISRDAAIVKGAISHVWVRGNTAPSNPHCKIIKK